MTVVRQYFAAAFLLVIGLVAYGCGDSATVNPVVELASLTVDPGTLQPAFSGGTTQYNVDVSNNISSVTVTAQPAVAGDSVAINGQATTSSVITLGAAGTTTPVNIVVSESGTNSRTYTVLFVRAGLTGNNSLQDLTVSPGTLDSPFTANDLNYSVDVANTVGSVTVTPTLSDPAATMTVNGQATNSGQARAVTLNPAGQPTDIPIVVTAQNGNPKTYQVTVSRGVSGNNNLGGLTVSPGPLNPTFNANRTSTSYTVNVASTVTSITVTPRVQDPAATMTVTPPGTISGQARTITLNGAGSNTFINIVVTAQNGTQKIYTVNVARAALGGNNNLSSLTVSPGPLTPAFSPAETNYTVDVGSAVTSVSVTPTRQDPAATITVNGTPATSGQGRSITLNGAGSNTLINIVVTAPNGSQKPYTLTVERAALGGNNNLSGLTVSPGPLAPAFAAATTNYTVDVGSTVTSVTVTPTRQDPNATITVNGTPSNSGQARTVTLNGAGSNTLINIVVTAPNGSQKPYTITVERAALGGNNNLSGLTVSPGPLTPAFAAATTTYTVDVASTVASITVTPSRQDPAATITVNGTPSNSGQARTVTLNGAGLNTLINIVVTAPNGSQKPYTITVERAALGGNNNLSGLTVSPGNLSPAFTAARTAYTVNAGSSDTSITVNATPQDPSATVTINGQGGNSRSIPLPGGPSSTEIEVLVIAPNGTDKTYLITVNQPAPAAPPAPPASAPDLIAEDDSCPRDSANACLPGTSDGDNITNVNTPRFRVPQPAGGETPSLYVDGVKVAANFAQGTNTLAPTSALSDGNHTITSTVTNTATTLESAQSPSLTVTIDTVAPGP
jgi:Cadherin-like beta sandwich domain/Bacterial Ig-like domain